MKLSARSPHVIALATALVAGCGGEPTAPVVPDAKLQNPGDKETGSVDPSNPLGGGVKPAKSKRGNK